MGRVDARDAFGVEYAPIRVAHWESNWPIEGTRRLALAIDDVEGVEIQLRLSRASARQLRRDLKDGIKWLDGDE